MSTGYPFFQPTLPAGTVLGNPNAAVGPPEAMTFAQLSQKTGLSGASVTLASAALVNIGAAASSNITVTGSVYITAFDVVSEGTLRIINFTGTPLLTYNATSMQLIGGASRNMIAGGTSLFRSLGGGNWIEEQSSMTGTFLQKGTGAVLRTSSAKLQESVSVLDFGAKGDGVTDDTAALTAAHNAGVALYYPAGRYIISSPIPLNNFQRLVGVPSESYINWTTDFQQASPSYNGMASIIQYSTGNHGYIFSGNPSGVSINGIVFRVGQARTAADMVILGMGNLGTWENCKFENIDTVFNNTTGAFGAAKLMGNRFFANGTITIGAWVDTVVSGNIFTSNGICFSFQSGGGYVLIVGNRFEFNTQVINSYQSRSGIVTGNLFDTHSNAAILLYNSNGWQITGNKFNGNGYNAGGSGTRSHLHIKGSTDGITISGNEFTAQRSDTGALVTEYIMECEALTGKSNKFTGNTDEYGWITAPVLDTYSTSANAFFFDTFTIPTGIGSPNTSSDALATYINGINDIAINKVYLFIKEARLITAYVTYPNIIVEGVGSSPIVMGNSTGSLSCQGMNNITYGSVTYKIYAGLQNASAQPNGFENDGVWAVGQPLFNTTPIAGSFIGWVKTVAGSPDTWQSFGYVNLITTVAALPAGTEGNRAYVTDALAPVFLGALTGGGTVVTPVFRNATIWVAG